MRPAPPSLPFIAQLGAFHPAMCRVNCRFTPYTLPIPEQQHNLLTSIPSFSNLTSLQELDLVRDAPRLALAPTYLTSGRSNPPCDVSTTSSLLHPPYP